VRMRPIRIGGGGSSSSSAWSTGGSSYSALDERMDIRELPPPPPYLATWAPRSPCFRIGERGSAGNDLTFDGPLLAAESLHIKLTGPHYFSLSIPRRTEHACTPLGFRPTRFIFSHAGTPPLSYPLSLGLARSPASPLRHARTPWHAAAEAGAGRLGSDALGGDTGHHPRRVGTAHRLLHRRPQPRPVQRCKAAPPNLASPVSGVRSAATSPRLAIAVPTMSSTGGEGSSPTRKVQTPRDAHLVHLLRMSSLFSLSDVPPRSFLWQGGREGGRG
jgi:hypothetical protein